MKVRNEYVRLKIGNREITKKNMILNAYLKKIVTKQIAFDSSDLKFAVCYLKLDTPLDVDADTDLTMGQFEVRFQYGKELVTTTRNTISVNYRYNGDFMFVYNYIPYMGDEISMLDGHKVMGIAFAPYNFVDDEGNNKIYKPMTYLDTREYDITLDSSQGFSIERLDTFSTDGYITGDINYPLQLFQEGCGEYIYKEDDNADYPIMANLYSVGFGTQKGVILEEYVVGTDIDIVQDDDYSYRFVLKRSEEQMKYAGSGMYPSTSLYPSVYKINKELQPSVNVVPRAGLYPSYGNYKYIIYKYRLYYVVATYDEETSSTNYSWKALNQYFTNSIYSEKTGYINCTCKIERND